MDHFTGVFDDSNLTTSQIFDHHMGSIVEMFGNLLDCWILRFMSEPFSPFLVVLLYLFPVVGDGDLSIVGIWFINFHSHGSYLSL